MAVSRKAIYLYEADRGIKIRLDVFAADADRETKIGSWVRFNKIDGMYSHCSVEGKEGEENTVHLSASVKIKKEKTGDFWVLA